MLKITNDGLTWSATVCFIAVRIWQQGASKGSSEMKWGKLDWLLSLCSGAKADTSDTVDVFNIAVCELAGHLPTYSQSLTASVCLSQTHLSLFLSLCISTSVCLWLRVAGRQLFVGDVIVKCLDRRASGRPLCYNALADQGRGTRHLTCVTLLHSVNLILFTVLLVILRISPHHSHHIHSHHLSLPRSFTPDLKLVSFTNPFLHLNCLHGSWTWTTHTYLHVFYMFYMFF